MKQQLVSFTSTDGLLLHGLYYDSGFNRSVIHIHGLAGNFYSSTYHQILATSYSKLGYNYLSTNNRGSEYIKQLKNVNTGQSTYYGYTFERFTQSDQDILGAISFIEHHGNHSFILQGHSSGCQKIIYTLSKHNLKPDFLVLLSPCDDVGLAQIHYGKDIFNQKIDAALASPQGLLPNSFFFDLPISTDTFLSHFGPKNKFDIFHYHQPHLPFTELQHNKIKTLVIFGDQDYFDNLNTIKSIYKQYQNYTINIIPQADHKYRGQEQVLASSIFKYVKQHSSAK